MQLSRLHLSNFRSYTDNEFSFDQRLTAIVGPNGSGKTNILEAIYTICMGKSFRDGDEELIRYEADWWKIQAEVDSAAREVRYQPSDKGKQLLIDGASKGRFTYRHQLPVVLFEPDDLYMLHGSPTLRRKYIDDMAQKLFPSYRQTFQRYERVVTQRNNLLKQKQPLAQLKDNIFVWDVSLAELGAKLIAARIELINLLNGSVSGIYSTVAGSRQDLRVEYVAPARQRSESELLAALHARLHDDLVRGFTTIGPHRHDIDFILNGQSAKHSASRGEVRSIILSLKSLETQLLSNARGETPLFLLDDVFSELDESRQKHVLDYGNCQTILTTTHVNQAKQKIPKIISLS